MTLRLALGKVVSSLWRVVPRKVNASFTFCEGSLQTQALMVQTEVGPCLSGKMIIANKG